MIENGQQAGKVKQDAILVFEESGRAAHYFCTEAEATERLDREVASGSGGSMFVYSDMSAQMIYSVAPNVRERVEEAKRKLNYELAIRDALTRHGVPVDRELRINIKRAIDDLRAGVLRPVL